MSVLFRDHIEYKVAHNKALNSHINNLKSQKRMECNAHYKMILHKVGIKKKKKKPQERQHSKILLLIKKYAVYNYRLPKKMQPRENCHYNHS